MLTRANVEQILDEHEVYSREPAAKEQNLESVILALAEKRATLLGRKSRVEDAIFVGWAFSLPIFRQDERYTALMRDLRYQLFARLSPEEASQHAVVLFPDDFLKLELYEMGAIVSRETAVAEIEKYLRPQ